MQIKPYQERNFNQKSIGIMAHGFKDLRKNFSKIKDIFYLLNCQDYLTINICGDSSEKLISIADKNCKCDLNNYGYIKEDLKLKEFYLKSNYILFLSMQDNSPNQIMEAMAYGSIMIAFDNDFAKEHIVNNHNGYLISKNLSKRQFLLILKKY